MASNLIEIQASMDPNQNIILIGGRGSGKSSVASLLHGRTGRALMSVDSMMEQLVGMDIPTMVSAHGWRYFRSIERQVVHNLSHEQGLIIDTGGGVVCELDLEGKEIYAIEKIKLLQSSGTLFWLHCSVASQQERIKTSRQRPSLTGKLSPVEELQSIMQVREAWYRAAASVELNTDKLSPETATEAILQYLKQSR